jgi:hypothetical protein
MLAEVSPLSSSWRARAVAARGFFGSEQAAHVYELVAKELEDWAASREHDLLTPRAAAEYSGLHVDSLARLRRTGKIKDYGSKNRPLYMRSELPRKASDSPSSHSAREAPIIYNTRTQIARAVVTRQKGGDR